MMVLKCILTDTAGAGQQDDSVHEYVLTTAYDISTATLNHSLVVHNPEIDGAKDGTIPTQVVFNK